LDQAFQPLRAARCRTPVRVEICADLPAPLPRLGQVRRFFRAKSGQF
jgi:hypothetical protein